MGPANLRSPVAASSRATRAATKRPADAAAIKIDRWLLDGVRTEEWVAAALEALLDERAYRDRVHDALIRVVAYRDEASDATIAGGARADGEETCGAAADGLAETTAAPAADAPTKPTLAEAVSRCLPPQKDLRPVLHPVPPLFKKISEKQAHAVTKSAKKKTATEAVKCLGRPRPGQEESSSAKKLEAQQREASRLTASTEPLSRAVRDSEETGELAKAAPSEASDPEKAAKAAAAALAADVAKSGAAPNTGADVVAGGAVTVQNNDRGGDEVEARDDETRGGGLDASTPSTASLDAKFCRESLGNELVYEAYRSQARYDKSGAAQKRGCKGKRARKRHRRKKRLRKIRSGGNAANIKAENKQATGSSSTKVKGRVSYIVGKAKTACLDATKVVEGRKSLVALLGQNRGVTVAVAATVAVAGATLAATACCWCGFICAAFVLHLAAVVATFGWASFQGSAAFDVLALVFAAAAPLGEASVEGLLGILAALGPLHVLVGAALGGALRLALLSSHLYQRAGIGCARLRGALVVSERRVFTCALALLAVGAASGWAPVLSWAAAVADALAVVSTLRFCGGLRVDGALLMYLPLVCAARTGGHHTRFVGTDGRASMLRLGCLAALVQPVASGSAKQLLPDVGAPYLIYSVFAVVMVAGIVLWLYLRQVQSSGVISSSQEALIDGQALVNNTTVQNDAMEACPDNGTPIVDGSSARDEASHVDITRKKSRRLAWLGRYFCCVRKRRPIETSPDLPAVAVAGAIPNNHNTDNDFGPGDFDCRDKLESKTADAMDESSSEDEALLDARIGRRVEIYWENDDLWFPGYIKCQRPVDGDLELGVVYDDEPEKVHYHPFYQHPFDGPGAPPPAAEGDPVQWRYVTSKKRTKRPTRRYVASSGEDDMQLVTPEEVLPEEGPPEEGPPEAGSQGRPKKQKLSKAETTVRAQRGRGTPKWRLGFYAQSSGDIRYVAERATDSRTKCKRCGKKLVKGALCFGRIQPRGLRETVAESMFVSSPCIDAFVDRFDAFVDRLPCRSQTKWWYHLECIFDSFKRVTRETKTITSVEDIKGFEGLDEDVKTRVRELIEEHKVERERRFQSERRFQRASFRKRLEPAINESEKKDLMRNFWQGARKIVMKFNALKEEGNPGVCEAIEEQERLLADPLRASRRILLASANANGLCEVELAPLSTPGQRSITLSSQPDEPVVLDHVAQETQLKSGLRRGDILVEVLGTRLDSDDSFLAVEHLLHEALADRQAVTLIVRPTTSTTEVTADAPHAQASNTSPPAANDQGMGVDQPANDSEMQSANTQSAPQSAVGPDESTAREPRINSWVQVLKYDGRWYHGRVASQRDGGDQLIIEYNNGETRPQLLCRGKFIGDKAPPPPRKGEPLPWCSAGPIVNWKLLRLPSPVALNKAKGEPTSDLPEPPTDSHHMSDVEEGSNDDIPSVEGTETGSVLEEGAPPTPHRDSWRKPFQWPDLARGAKPGADSIRKILTVFVPYIYCINYTGVALASQTLGCTPVPVEFMGFFPRLYFMTMACAVLFGVSTGCLPIEYAKGLFKAMCISDLPAVQKWILQRGMQGADDLPLDLLALIWAASAFAWCRARGWKAWSEVNGMQDGFFKRFCGAGIKGFGIPANLWMSGLWLPKNADPKGPLTASLDRYEGDTLFAFIRAICSGLNLTMPLLCLWAECTGRAKSVIRRAFKVSEAEAEKYTRFAHVYAHLNAQCMLNVFRKYRFGFKYSLNVAVDIYGEGILGGESIDDLVDAAKKGDLSSWQQFTFLKWCCWWWPPWYKNPLPVAVTVFLPNTLNKSQCAEVIARLVSQQHDVNPPHFSEIFGWPCWWCDLRDNFYNLISPGADRYEYHEYRWWCWLWLAELQFIDGKKWELREKQLERHDVIAAELNDFAPDSDSELEGTNLEELVDNSLRRLGTAPIDIYGDEVGDSEYLTLKFTIRQWLADVYGEPGPPTSLKTEVTWSLGSKVWEAEPLIFNRDAKRDYPEADRKIGNALNVEVKVISGPEGKGANHDSNPLDFPVARHWQQGRDYAACRDDVSKAFLEASEELYAAFKGFKFVLPINALAMTDQASELIAQASKQELKFTRRRTEMPSPRLAALFDKLVQRLSGFGLKPFDVDSDGNCQFRALAHQLFADEAHHAAVRQTVCGQLCEFADRYRDFVEGYEAFVDALTRIEWGNHVTLHAAADAYNARIILVTTYDDEWKIQIDPTGTAHNGETPTTVWLGLIDEWHYVSVVPMSSNDESNVALPRGNVAAGLNNDSDAESISSDTDSD